MVMVLRIAMLIPTVLRNSDRADAVIRRISYVCGPMLCTEMLCSAALCGRHVSKEIGLSRVTKHRYETMIMTIK